jgi:hypothetical protein
LVAAFFAVLGEVLRFNVLNALFGVGLVVVC